MSGCSLAARLRGAFAFLNAMFGCMVCCLTLYFGIVD